MVVMENKPKEGVSLGMQSLWTEIGNRKENKPFTLGPEAIMIIPGIGLIWAPLSLSITWKQNTGELKVKEMVVLIIGSLSWLMRAIRKPVSVYFWPYICLSFHGRVSHRVQDFDYGASCQTCSVFFPPQRSFLQYDRNFNCII